MAEIKKRKVYGTEFKGTVGLEAVRRVKTVNEIAQQHGVHPAMAAQWRKDITFRAGTLFEGKRGPKAEAEHEGEDRLYGKIGRLKMELDWLKKVRPVSGAVRLGWIEAVGELPLVRQCELAGVSRATVYRPRAVAVPDDDDLILWALIDEEFTRHPFYGSRRMVVILERQGWLVNRKHVQRLMRILGLAGMAPGPGTPVQHPGHKVYPYLLRGVAIVRPNHVWSTDITYIRLARGFAYLVAIIDWYSRRVLTWRISNSMDASFCVDCLEEALINYGKPEIFNTDQGSPFTSVTFTEALKREGVDISMDWRGRALDNIFVERLWRNVKYEDVYLNGYATMGELHAGLTRYFAFYKGERPYQGLEYRTLNVVYESGKGGGAMIVDKYGSVPDRSSPQSAPIR